MVPTQYSLTGHHVQLLAVLELKHVRELVPAQNHNLAVKRVKIRTLDYQ